MARSVIGDLLSDLFGGIERRLRRIDRAIDDTVDSIHEQVWRSQQRVLRATATVLRILALLEAVRLGRGVGLLLVAAFVPLSVFRVVARQHRRAQSRGAWFFGILCLVATIAVLVAAYVMGDSALVVVLAATGEVTAWLGRRAAERADEIAAGKLSRAFRDAVRGW